MSTPFQLPFLSPHLYIHPYPILHLYLRLHLSAACIIHFHFEFSPTTRSSPPFLTPLFSTPIHPLRSSQHQLSFHIFLPPIHPFPSLPFLIHLSRLPFPTPPFLSPSLLPPPFPFALLPHPPCSFKGRAPSIKFSFPRCDEADQRYPVKLLLWCEVLWCYAVMWEAVL